MQHQLAVPEGEGGTSILVCGYPLVAAVCPTIVGFSRIRLHPLPLLTSALGVVATSPQP